MPYLTSGRIQITSGRIQTPSWNCTSTDGKCRFHRCFVCRCLSCRLECADQGWARSLSTTTVISVGAGVVSLVFLPFVGLPAWAAWPWLITSIAIHLIYFAALIESYRTGDLGQVYPIARGSAPLMTGAVTAIFVGEQLSAIGWLGLLTLVAGVLLLSARGGRELAQIDRRAVGFALFTALTICAYPWWMGWARLSANPNAYSLWLFVGMAMVMVPYALYRDGQKMSRQCIGTGSAVLPVALCNSFPTELPSGR